VNNIERRSNGGGGREKDYITSSLSVRFEEGGGQKTWERRGERKNKFYPSRPEEEKNAHIIKRRKRGSG